MVLLQKRTNMKIYCLLFLGLLGVQCDSSDTPSATLPTTPPSIAASIVSPAIQALQDSMDLYIRGKDNCDVVSEEPFMVAFYGDTSDLVDCSFGGDNQLEMNVCSQVAACLVEKELRTLIEEHLAQHPAQQEAFLQEILVFLEDAQQKARQAGARYEGGSMQASVVNRTFGSLLEEKNKELTAQLAQPK